MIWLAVLAPLKEPSANKTNLLPNAIWKIKWWSDWKKEGDGLNSKQVTHVLLCIDPIRRQLLNFTPTGSLGVLRKILIGKLLFCQQTKDLLNMDFDPDHEKWQFCCCRILTGLKIWTAVEILLSVIFTFVLGSACLDSIKANAPVIQNEDLF